MTTIPSTEEVRPHAKVRCRRCKNIVFWPLWLQGRTTVIPSNASCLECSGINKKFTITCALRPVFSRG